jgi:hypothetical protein
MQFRFAVMLLFCGSTVSFQTPVLNDPSTGYPRSEISRNRKVVSTRKDSFPSWFRCWQYVSSTSLSATSQSAQEFGSSQSSSTLPLPASLNEKQLDFTCGYLNKHHRDVLVAFAETLSSLGEIKSKRNSWSGGSYKIESATLVDINTLYFTLEVGVKERNKDVQLERVTVNLGKEKTIVSLCINSCRIFLILFYCYLLLQMPCLLPKFEAMEAIATAKTSTYHQFLGI